MSAIVYPDVHEFMRKHGNYLHNDNIPIVVTSGGFDPMHIGHLRCIQETNKIDIKPSMIQPIQEIKSLGKHKVKISLHSAVDAEITITVLSADTIQ